MDRYKALGRVLCDQTVSNSSKVLYKVPLPTQFEVTDTGPRTDATVLYTIVSSIIVCNQHNAASDFSIAVREDDSAATPTTTDWIFFKTEVAANSTMIINPGITLPGVPSGTTGVDGADIFVVADTFIFSFHAYGVEVTQ
jgi:hypothetical protein